MPADDLTVSASQIGRGLNLTSARIHQLLRSIPHDLVHAVAGNPTKFWRLSSLPLSLHERLEARRSKLQLPTVCELWSGATKRWEPRVPIAKAHPDDRTKAQKLRSAIQEFAEAVGIRKATLSSLEKDGAARYKSIFGRGISGRHWRRLVIRTVRRAGVESDYAREEIYLADRTKGKVARRRRCHTEFGALDAEIDRAREKTITVDVRNRIWTAIFVEYTFLLTRGCTAKNARADLASYLFTNLPTFAQTLASLKRALLQRCANWESAGRRIEAVLDKRCNNSGRRTYDPLPEDIANELIARAVAHKGRISQAFREMWDEGKLPKQIYERFGYSWLDKSRVPRAIRDRVTPQVRALMKFAQGPREATVKGPTIRRSYEGIASGEEFTADDVTSNMYTYRLLPSGKWLIYRPQMIVWCDTATSLILLVQQIEDTNYSSLDIMKGIIELHDTIGLADFIYFERGIWKRSLLISGKGDPGYHGDGISWDERVIGFKRMAGITISHARRPQPKIIEGTGKDLQARMDSLRGYAGRNERVDRPEILKRAFREVRNGTAHPSQWFLSPAEHLAKWQEAANHYNEDPQSGRLGGLSPRLAYQEWMGKPPSKFSAENRFLLTTNRRTIKVSENGVLIKIGAKTFQYMSGSTALLVGQRVWCWFSLTDPSIAYITDLNGKNPVAVPRVENPAQRNAGEAELRSALKKARDHFNTQRNTFAKLKHDFPEFLSNTAKREPQVDAAASESLVRTLVREGKKARRETKQNAAIEESISRANQDVGAALGSQAKKQAAATIDALKRLKKYKIAAEPNR